MISSLSRPYNISYLFDRPIRNCSSFSRSFKAVTLYLTLVFGGVQLSLVSASVLPARHMTHTSREDDQWLHLLLLNAYILQRYTLNFWLMQAKSIWFSVLWLDENLRKPSCLVNTYMWECTTPNNHSVECTQSCLAMYHAC